MALDNFCDPSNLFQRVDILSVVAQQLSFLFQDTDETMCQRRFELSRENFLLHVKKSHRKHS